MNLKNFFLSLLVLISGCAHKGAFAEAENEAAMDNVRLAQAQVVTNNGSSVKGTVNFEQMPNSVIVVFRIEGLEPRNTYQLLVQEGRDCRSLEGGSTSPLSQIRTNKNGVAENTFKIENFSVSGERSLLGNSVIVASHPFETEGRPPVPFVCGTIQPLHPSQALLK